MCDHTIRALISRIRGVATTRSTLDCPLRSLYSWPAGSERERIGGARYRYDVWSYSGTRVFPPQRLSQRDGMMTTLLYMT